VSKYGRLLDPEEMRVVSRSDVSVFPPSVQFRYQRELEAPQESEGFSRIDVLPFVRSSQRSADRRSAGRQAAGPESAGIAGQITATGRAVILWCDGVLQRSRAGHRTPMNPEDLEVLDGRGAHLGVVLRKRHRLDPAQCVYVGSGSQDPGFARRLGFEYRPASEFFPVPPV